MVAIKLNKSKAVREYLKQHPEAKPKQIVEALATQGVVLSAAVASQIKNRVQKDNAIKDTVVMSLEGRGYTLQYVDFQKAMRFVESVGGIENAKTIVDDIARVLCRK